MKHRNIIHRIPVDKEMMIKSIAELLYHGYEIKYITKQKIISNLSWTTWYCGYGVIEDQPEPFRDLYPQATKIYLKLYPSQHTQ